ncbi:MAG: hypothetical protein ACREQW_18595 [Candidatus Binatia bacterium]
MVMKELTIEELTEEAMKLLVISLDELYVVLGCQLLASVRPARVAGIIRYFSDLSEPKDSKDREAKAPPALDTMIGSGGLEAIYKELQQDGRWFFGEVREDLRRGLCTEDILNLADKIDSSSMQIIVLIVGAILKLPPQIESISATVAAIICASGLRSFCR